MKTLLKKLLVRNENSRISSIIRNALSLASPFMLIGAFALILKDFPNAEYQDFIQSAINGILYKLLDSLFRFTLGSLSLILSITIGISYRNQVDRNRHGMYLLISLVSYLIFVYDGVGAAFLSDHFSPLYSTVAIFVSYFACSILNLFVDQMTRRLEPFSVLGDTRYTTSMHIVKPIAILLLIMVGFRGILFAIFRDYTFADVIQIFVDAIFFNCKPTFWWGLLYVFFAHFLAFFGVAGMDPLQNVTNVFEESIKTNEYYLSLHEPNLANAMYSSTFIKTFCMIGGFGSVLCLIIAFFIATKEQSNHKIGKTLFIPTLFNISDTALFGLPIIFNPILLIPFIMVPIIQYLVSALLTSTGVISIAVHAVDGLMPCIFSGYAVTDSISGSFLQVINLAIGVLIYIPFVRLLNVPHRHILVTKYKDMEKAIKDGESIGYQVELLNGDKSINVAAKNLLSDLYDAIRQDEIALYYQPQIGRDGKVIGAEGLFRWKHPDCGNIYPPLAIQLVREDGFSNQLTYLIIRKACSALQRLNIYGVEHFKLSVNILPQQMEDDNFAEKVKNIISDYKFGNNTLALEITEQGALSSLPYVERVVDNLKELGVDFIMDDFGMGHSSMTSMQYNHFSHVKLDGNLVKDVLVNQRTQDIVEAICNLASKLDCKIIAEYVETEEQKERLKELGCEIYQGYLYSKALPFDDFVDFLKEKGSF